MIYLRAGSSLLIEVQVLDSVLGLYQPVVPDSITISIIDPYDTIVVSSAAMTSTSTLGYYTYLFQSTQYMLNGGYRLLFHSILSSEVVYTKELIGFVLVDSVMSNPIFTHFDYFALFDITNVLWYWSIVSSSRDASDAYYTLTNTIPTDQYLVGVDITPNTGPHALQVLDELGGTAYIYPDTLGQVVVDSTLPSGVLWNIGSGLDMRGRDSIVYRYTGLSYLSALLTPMSYPSL